MAGLREGCIVMFEQARVLCVVAQNAKGTYLILKASRVIVKFYMIRNAYQLQNAPRQLQM